MIKVFIDGKEGTTGLKIFERFSNRDDVELLQISEQLRKDTNERKRLINSSDITFLCLPDEAAKQSVSLCENPNVRIIDTSTAHRTSYGWAYGFPELSETFYKRIEYGKRIAVPGCHASGFNSIVYPLCECGILPKDYPLVCFSLTGYSGGGKKMIAEYEDFNRGKGLSSPRQYGLNQNHKHLPEMAAIAGLCEMPIFTPIVSDFYSGMQVTIPLYTKMLNFMPNLADLHEVFVKKYENQKMIKVRPLGYEGLLDSNSMALRDDMEIIISGNDERALIISRFDNLGKGASGAAMQCMNIMLGLDESYGLNIGE